MILDITRMVQLDEFCVKMQLNDINDSWDNARNGALDHHLPPPAGQTLLRLAAHENVA